MKMVQLLLNEIGNNGRYNKIFRTFENRLFIVFHFSLVANATMYTLSKV